MMLVAVCNQHFFAQYKGLSELAFKPWILLVNKSLPDSLYLIALKLQSDFRLLYNSGHYKPFYLKEHNN